MIRSSLRKLELYCHGTGFKGWDLFDGLNSALFKNSVCYRNEFLRLAWIQLFKRSAINLRKIAFVPKAFNAKGLALFASGMISKGNLDEAIELLEQLKKMVCEGYSGASWGYNFDWQARAFYVPVGKPNMVTTVFAANTFLDYYEKTSADYGLSLASDACRFIMEQLVVFEDENKLCFGYIPGEKTRVHNANMLGAALLGRVYSHHKSEQLLEKSTKAMAYSMEALSSDYSWPYGERSHHQFIDNFHTGFNLVALQEWMDHTGITEWHNKLRKAYTYYLATFFLDDGRPKYYHNSLHPIDIHCSAQGIVTCLKLKDLDRRSLPLAKKIAEWAIENMQDPKGFFYYQKHKYFTNKIPYIRWAQAWMYYALSLYLKHTE